MSSIEHAIESLGQLSLSADATIPVVEMDDDKAITKSKSPLLNSPLFPKSREPKAVVSPTDYTSTNIINNSMTIELLIKCKYNKTLFI
jgi:hypothetical protein